jgi:hypothetical protein
MEKEHLPLFNTRNEKIVYGRLNIDTARARDALEGRKPTRYPKQPLSLATK